MCHIGYMSRLELFYFSSHLPGWVAEHVTKKRSEKFRLASREKSMFSRKFCRGSTPLREIRRFRTFSGVGVRICFACGAFFFVPQEVSPYIRVSPKFPLYVTLGIIFWVGCYIYITSDPILPTIYTTPAQEMTTRYP